MCKPEELWLNKLSEELAGFFGTIEERLAVIEEKLYIRVDEKKKLSYERKEQQNYKDETEWSSTYFNRNEEEHNMIGSEIEAIRTELNEIIKPRIFGELVYERR